MGDLATLVLRSAGQPRPGRTKLQLQSWTLETAGPAALICASTSRSLPLVALAITAALTPPPRAVSSMAGGLAGCAATTLAIGPAQQVSGTSAQTPMPVPAITDTLGDPLSRRAKRSG